MSTGWLAAKIIDGVQYIIALAILAGFFFGLFLVVTVPFELAKMADARTWPYREGTITYSRASPTYSARYGEYWEPVIRGAYDDTGEGFWIERVRYGDVRLGSGKGRSQEQAAAYPVGSKVKVYASPDRPRDTLLEPFASTDTMMTLWGIGAALALLPLALYLYGRARAWAKR